MTSAVAEADGISTVSGIAGNSFGTATGIGFAQAGGNGGATATALGIGLAGAISPTSIPSWPSGVPYAPQVDSWKAPNVFIDPIATDVDSGNQRLRSKPGSGAKILQFNIMMSLTEYQTFESFCRDTLTFGASRWTMLVWVGWGFETHTVQFDKGKPPEPTAMPPNLVSVVMNLRVLA